MDIKEYIDKIPMWATKKNSLIAIREFLANMGIEKKKGKKPYIIHVAGTNGKGSVCAYLSSALISMGYEVGTFISPHLVDLNERIRINMIPVCDKDFENAGEYVRETAEKMKSKDYEAPTYFEFLFYMAMKIFYDKLPDFIVMETGLGGLYDITNALEEKDLCVITSISKDHEQYLGNTVDKICSQKAGIMREGTALVYDDNTEEVKKSMDNFALHYKAKNIKKLSELKGFCPKLNPDKDFSQFKAAYQRRNASLCVLALLSLYEEGYIPSFELDKLKKVISTTVWEGRMQEVFEGVYLDGAHNEDGISEFVKTCKSLCEKNDKKAHLLFSIVGDKDIEAVFEKLKLLEAYVSEVYIARIDSERGAKLKDIHEGFEGLKQVQIKEYDSIAKAFDGLLQEKKEDVLCFATGSLYMIGEVLKYLR